MKTTKFQGYLVPWKIKKGYIFLPGILAEIIKLVKLLKRLNYPIKDILFIAGCLIKKLSKLVQLTQRSDRVAYLGYEFQRVPFGLAENLNGHFGVCPLSYIRDMGASTRRLKYSPQMN